MTIPAKDLREGDILHIKDRSWEVIYVRRDNRFPQWPGVIVAINETGNRVFRDHMMLEIDRSPRKEDPSESIEALSQVRLESDGVIGDGMIEIGPDDPEYASNDELLRRWAELERQASG